ncbi:MAG: polysaccharide biosynthesis tyrosine autokinase [Anaerolineae bacterium]|nr:polysaccharide biosynthesis tyrosine autokinase [Anaerolineae bacterium]
MVELRQYVRGIFRWWWLIALSTCLAAGASYYASSKMPRIYQTTTTLIVGQVMQQENPTGSDFATTEMLAESYASMAVRQPVLQATVDSLGLNMSWQELRGQVYAYSIPRTQLMAIAVEDISPERAVAIADQVAYQLVLQSPNSPENQKRQERSGFVHERLDDLEKRISTSRARVEELEAKLATAMSAREIQDLQEEITSLETLINDWQKDYLGLLGFLTGSDSPNYLSVIEPAQLPYSPISPNVKMNVLLAAAVGFVLAVSAALVLEYLDDTLRSTEDLGTTLGLTVLGSIGRIKGGDHNDKLITAHGPYSPLSEAYRMVRTNVQFLAVDQPAKSIMVTSPNPGEGKSLTAANLGVIMAQANLRTIIVDTDLRRPILHKIFRVPNLEGVTDLLRSQNIGLEIEGHLRETGIENLRILPSGPLHPNSAELLSSQRMTDMVRLLREMADVIIFDSSPILAVTDASVLANRVDGVILVIQAKQTRRDTTREAMKRLNQVGANILGAVLNQVSGKEGGYYSSKSYYTRSEYGMANRIHRTGQRHWWQRLFAAK